MINTHIYGFFPDDEFIEENYKRVFFYLKAKIEAEKINPEDDFDNEIHMKLLEEIASADLDFWRRRELLGILKRNDEE